MAMIIRWTTVMFNMCMFLKSTILRLRTFTLPEGEGSDRKNQLLGTELCKWLNNKWRTTTSKVFRNDPRAAQSSILSSANPLTNKYTSLGAPLTHRKQAAKLWESQPWTNQTRALKINKVMYAVFSEFADSLRIKLITELDPHFCKFLKSLSTVCCQAFSWLFFQKLFKSSFLNPRLYGNRSRCPWKNPTEQPQKTKAVLPGGKPHQHKRMAESAGLKANSTNQSWNQCSNDKKFVLAICYAAFPVCCTKHVHIACVQFTETFHLIVDADWCEAADLFGSSWIFSLC